MNNDKALKNLGIQFGILLGFIMPVGFGLIWGWKFGLGFFIISQALLTFMQLIIKVKEKDEVDKKEGLENG
jgi:hypothetical protein